MFDNRIQLFAQTSRNDLRYRITKHLFGIAPADLFQFLLGAVDGRGEGSVREGTHRFHPIGDEIGVLYHDLVSFLRRQVVELCQHLISSTQIQRCLIIGILEALTGHQNRTEDGVFFLHEMNVAGRNHRNVEIITQFYDGFIELDEFVHGFDHSIAQHELVISQRLHFQIVVEFRNIAQFPPALSCHNGTEQLACLTGRAENQALAMFDQLGFWNQWATFEIFQVGHGNQLVQVFQTHVVLHQNDLVVRLHLGRVAGAKRRIDLLQSGRFLFRLQQLHHFNINFRQNSGIVTGAVMIEVAAFEIFCHCIQLVIFQIREHGSRHGYGIYIGIVKVNAAAAVCLPQEAAVEIRVVCHQNGILTNKLAEFLHGFALFWCVFDHGIGDAGQFGDIGRDRLFRIYKGVEGFQHIAVPHAYRTDFRDTLAGCRKTRGLQVEDDELSAELSFFRTFDSRDHVIHIIALDTVNDLEIVPFISQVHSIGEALTHAVVGDGDGRMSPIVGLFHQIGNGSHTVHGGHIGM